MVEDAPESFDENRIKRDTEPRLFSFTPFVLRYHARHTDYQLKAGTRERLKKLGSLGNSKMLGPNPDWSIEQTLNAAADLQLTPLRQGPLRWQHNRARKRVLDMIRRLIGLVGEIKKLPPTSRQLLNKHTSVHCCDFFDTETVESLVDKWAMELRGMHSLRAAARAHDAIFEPVAGLAGRTSRSDLIDLWDSIPASTRTRVEAGIRNQRSIPSTVAFLKLFIELLQSEQLKKKRRRFPSRPQIFFKRITALGIKPGLAYKFDAHVDVDGNLKGKDVPSTFQKYCKAALEAFGDPTQMSRDRIKDYKRSVRPKKS